MTALNWSRVSDTGPIIVLAKVGRLDLLTAGGRSVLISDTVAREPVDLSVVAGLGRDLPVNLTWHKLCSRIIQAIHGGSVILIHRVLEVAYVPML